MKLNEIKAQRIRMEYTQGEVARQLHMNVNTYRGKENGHAQFKENEKFDLAEVLEFTPTQMNDFLFDGRLPIGNDSANSAT